MVYANPGSSSLDVLSAFDESLDLTNILRFIALWHLVRYELVRDFIILPPIPLYLFKYIILSFYLSNENRVRHFNYFKIHSMGFPGGAVVGNPPANAGDTGSCPGPGRSHMPRSG